MAFEVLSYNGVSSYYKVRDETGKVLNIDLHTDGSLDEFYHGYPIGLIGKKFVADSVAPYISIANNIRLVEK